MNAGTPANACVYCGQRPGTTRDHVPPRGFFQHKCPNDAQLLSVPCCEPCRDSDQRHDTFVRDALAGLLDSTAHPYVHKHVTERVSRSIRRGGKNLQRMIDILKMKDAVVLTPDGPRDTSLPAMNLDAPEFDRFFERIGRAVLYDAYGQSYFSGRSEWVKQFDMPHEYFSEIVRTSQCRVILDVFAYCARRMPERDQDYILVQFYNSLGFVIRFKTGEAQQAPRPVPSKAAADGGL